MSKCPYALGGCIFSTSPAPQLYVRTLSRWIYTLLTLAVLLSGAAPLSSFGADDAAAQTLEGTDEIIRRGIIRVAITKFDLPGFHWRNAQGELEGPEIELARLIGRLLRVGVEFVDDCPTFDCIIDTVASKRADIGVSKLSQTPTRILHVRFSDPYLTVRQAFLFNRVFVGAQSIGREPQHALRNFSGTIGVIANSAYVGFARRNFPNAQIVEMQTWEDSIGALVNGRVDALYRDEFEIRRVLRKNPAFNVRFGSAAVTDQKSLLSFAICSNCSRLREFINYQISDNRVPFVITEMLASNTH